jgi:hypothetical protein
MNKQDKVEFELLKREVLSMHEKVNKIDTSLHGLLDAWTTVGGVLKACKWLGTVGGILTGFWIFGLDAIEAFFKTKG